MNRRITLIIIAIIILTAPPSYARDIYVKLSGGSKFSIGVTQGTLTITDANGSAVGAGESTVISVSGGVASVSGFSLNLPLRITGPGYLKFNGRTYRGSFLITQRAGLLNVVNIEQYLYGVLPAEVGASWHMEALKAQAISARTYALKQSMNRSDKGYDVVDTDADQVYKGVGIETTKTNQAVSSTSGQVLVYGNELAYTYFHSDSGGHTANAKDVWGSHQPYLVGVPEVVDYKSPASTWSAKFSNAKIQSAIKKITGADLGTITELQVSEVDEGGRAVTITAVGKNGTRTVKASQFRLNMDPRTLRSTMFTPSGGAFNVNNQTTPSGLVSSQKKLSISTSGLTFEEEQRIAKMTADGVFTTTELIDMLTNPNKKKNYYQTGIGRSTQEPQQTSQPAKPKSKYGYSIEKSGSDFVFYGRGWGHGVGLCQWGAMAMADNGYTAEQILTHYYPGTNVRKIK